MRRRAIPCCALLLLGCATSRPSTPTTPVADAPRVPFHAVVALEQLADPPAPERTMITLPTRAPGMRELYTYRAARRPAEWAWALRTVTLAGVHAGSHRAVFVLTDAMYGARSGVVRERIDVIDYRRRRHVNRVNAEYPVHVAGGDQEGIERLTGEFRDDVSILGRLVSEVGAEYWGDEELAVSPNGRRIVTRAPGRSGLLVANRFGRRQRWLLPDGVFSAELGPVFSSDNRHVALGCSDYSAITSSGGQGTHGLCLADAVAGGHSLVEMPRVSRPLWRDADTVDVISFERSTSPEGRGSYEACLQRVELDPPSATEVACWPGWIHREPLRAVPDDPQTAILRLDSWDVANPSSPSRLLWIHRGDGEVLQEATIPRAHQVLRVLAGARVITGHGGNVRVLDLAQRAQADLGVAQLGGELTAVHRQSVDGVEHVYGLIAIDEDRHRLVQLDLAPLFAP